MTVEMLQQIFFTCVIPLTGILCTYGIAFLRKQMKVLQDRYDNELFTKYSEMLTNTIETCVIATNQTYVDELKKQGRFGYEEHDIAFHKTYDAVMDILTDEAKRYLSEVYADLDMYIAELIQEQVRWFKTK